MALDELPPPELGVEPPLGDTPPLGAGCPPPEDPPDPDRLGDAVGLVVEVVVDDEVGRGVVLAWAAEVACVPLEVDLLVVDLAALPPQP